MSFVLRESCCHYHPTRHTINCFGGYDDTFVFADGFVNKIVFSNALATNAPSETPTTISIMPSNAPSTTPTAKNSDASPEPKNKNSLSRLEIILISGGIVIIIIIIVAIFIAYKMYSIKNNETSNEGNTNAAATDPTTTNEPQNTEVITTQTTQSINEK